MQAIPPRVAKDLTTLPRVAALSAIHHMLAVTTTAPTPEKNPSNIPSTILTQWLVVSVMDKETGRPIEYKDPIQILNYKDKYEEGMCWELGRLA